MKVNITVSLCISKDFEIEVENCTPENLYNQFMIQHWFPSEVSNYIEDNKWFVDDIEIINNEQVLS